MSRRDIPTAALAFDSSSLHPFIAVQSGDRPMKNQPPPLQIETPCPKRWENMTGDATRRFCEHCQLHVHNLSEMSDRERKRFVAESGGTACIAYELRPDGTMITPSRWTWLIKPWKRARFVITALLVTLFPFLFSACATRRTVGKMASTQDANCTTQNASERHIVAGTPMPTLRPTKR